MDKESTTKKAYQIKFGTDGWREIIADKFTVENVARISQGTASWIIESGFNNPSITIGNDCRFGGDLFTETVSRVMIINGIRVVRHPGIATTPMVSLATRDGKHSVGIVITASHNPSGYNGFKVKSSTGGPLNGLGLKEIEALIPDFVSEEFERVNLNEEFNKGMYSEENFEKAYLSLVKKHFELNKIERSGLQVVYDAMYGAGQFVFSQILPKATLFRCERDLLFGGISPEPVMKNLEDCSVFVKHLMNMDICLVTDGDADRIGLMDGRGEYIDTHHVILLLLHYLVNYKGLTGKVCTGFSSSVKITAFCKKHNLPLEIVPIGFKHISEIMSKEDILLGGEESGGISVRGHIPERDGLWMGLMICELMAQSGKTLNDLIDEIYDEVGSFGYHRIDLTVTDDQKKSIMEICKNGGYDSFGKHKVLRLENLDGYKYYLSEDEWIMIRPSGTEPVLRTYAEGKSRKEAKELLKSCHETILN